MKNDDLKGGTMNLIKKNLRKINLNANATNFKK